MQIISIPAGTGRAHISCWRCIRLELCAYGSKGTGISVGDRPLGERSERDFRPADVEDLAEGFCQAVISVPALPELLVCAWPGAGTYVPTDPLVMGVCCNLCLAYRSRTDLCDGVLCERRGDGRPQARRSIGFSARSAQGLTLFGISAEPVSAPSRYRTPCALAASSSL